MNRYKRFFKKQWNSSSWYLSMAGLRNQINLKRYHNLYSGKRCFLIGNGPSLKEVDLSLLKNEITFGLNRIYLLFAELGFETTYLVSVNPLVIQQFSVDLGNCKSQKFLSWNERENMISTKNTMFVRNYPAPKFSLDLCDSIWQGTTVTYVALQIAYYMGIKKVILIGVDHSFQTKGEPHKMVTSQGDDPNHFHPSYFGKGIQWQLPDLETSELAYMMAKYQFEKIGRQVVDATIGGKLQVFPKVDYYSLFS